MMDFMVASIGRSGTKWLADFLDSAPNAKVRHEWMHGHLNMARRSMEDPSLIDTNWDRLKLAHGKIRKDTELMGEVNSLNWCWMDRFKTLYPSCKMFHLVRDPRDVVRSIMTRIPDHSNPTQIPNIHLSDYYHSKWRSWSTFQKACYFWVFINERIQKDVSKVIVFEKLLNDRDYFFDTFVNPFKLQITSSEHEKASKTKNNHSKRHTFPHHSEWDNKLKSQLTDICGELMTKYGY